MTISLQSAVSTPVSRPLPGMVGVMREAAAHGYVPGDARWVNLGQGQPETGPLDGAASTLSALTLEASDYSYGPLEGLSELREQIAAYYNALYRRGSPSQYSAENVMICSGGRVAIARALLSLGAARLGHLTPDYAAYGEMLNCLPQLSRVVVPTSARDGFAVPVAQVAQLVPSLDVFLFSNPHNPTGRALDEGRLDRLVSAARDHERLLLVDEFYSQYIWDERESPSSRMGRSVASVVKDVDRDPVLLFDGLTKNFRRPGWRVAWAVGPKETIRRVSAVAAFLDGGAPLPMQRAALTLFASGERVKEFEVIRSTFHQKRNALLESLRALDFDMSSPSEGTFYLWAGLSRLPKHLRDGRSFFRYALQQQLIVVPGEVFDLRKETAPSREDCNKFLRISFGPSLATVLEGVQRIKAVLES